MKCAGLYALGNALARALGNAIERALESAFQCEFGTAHTHTRVRPCVVILRLAIRVGH